MLEFLRGTCISCSCIHCEGMPHRNDVREEVLFQSQCLETLVQHGREAEGASRIVFSCFAGWIRKQRAQAGTGGECTLQSSPPATCFG